MITTQKRAYEQKQQTNIEPYHLNKWRTPRIEVQELDNFKKFKTKIKLGVKLINANK